MKYTGIFYEDQTKYIQEMEKYISSLKKMKKKDRKRESINALKRTGVLDKNGKEKKRIVTR